MKFNNDDLSLGNPEIAGCGSSLKWWWWNVCFWFSLHLGTELNMFAEVMASKQGFAILLVAWVKWCYFL